MKRLYVISDSHGYRDFDMLLAASRDADAYAHLGDHASDGEEFARKTANSPLWYGATAIRAASVPMKRL